MAQYEVQIHWEPSTIVMVEADSKEEAEQQAIEEAGQPEVDHIDIEEVKQ